MSSSDRSSFAALLADLAAGRISRRSFIAGAGSLGLSADLRNRFRWAHAAIAVKGAAPGTALERVDQAFAVATLGKVFTPTVRLDDLSVEH